MSESKHTKGPWIVGPSCGNDSARIDDKNGRVIGSIKVKHLTLVDKGFPVYQWSEEMEANATLVASAPRMAAALQRAARLLAELPGFEQTAQLVALRKEIVETIKEATPEHYGLQKK